MDGTIDCSIVQSKRSKFALDAWGYGHFMSAAIKNTEKLDIEILKISKDAQETQEKKIEKLRETRDSKLLEEKMKKLSDACKKDLNLVPYLVEVAEAGGTVGEIVEVMKEVYGEWEESFGI